MTAHTPTPLVDDVTFALRNDALEMDRLNKIGIRANGDAERLRATADYIDRLSNSNDALVAALEELLAVRALSKTKEGCPNNRFESALKQARAALKTAKVQP